MTTLIAKLTGNLCSSWPFYSRRCCPPESRLIRPGFLKTLRRSWLTLSGNNAREGATKDHSSELPSEGEGLRMVERAAFYHLCMSSLEPALAGEFRREPVHAEGERELAAVVQVVFEHMPDHPGARQLDWRAIPVVGKGLVHVGGTPARQTIRHELPGAVEALGQLVDGWDGCPQRQRNLVPTRIHLHLRAFVFAQEIGEPVGTAADDVQGILADGAEVRCGT